MKKFASLFIFIFISVLLKGQSVPWAYHVFSERADSLYKIKDFKNSALYYSKAFQTFGDKGLINDRYNAACSWSLAGYPDSAFFNLERIAKIGKYSDTLRLTTDPELKSLKSDIRWRNLLAIVKANKTEIATASPEYFALVRKADSLYNVKEYEKSALMYSQAFLSYGNKAYINDRYSAASCWALAGNHDSAFYQLESIATHGNFSDTFCLNSDPELRPLHSDVRWKELMKIVKMNREAMNYGSNKPLSQMLDTIHEDDQKYRLQIKEVVKRSGRDSKEYKDLWMLARQMDSINLIKVKSILDKYGWLGSNEIGVKGNTTLFLVIQHSDIKTQQEYLPMMREAVRNNKAMPSSLAFLEDRIAIGTGKNQIYGSQIGVNPNTFQYFIYPLEDPGNVDKRRASVGLGTMSEYISNWGLIWNLEQYKRDLPEIEKLVKDNPLFKKQ